MNIYQSLALSNLLFAETMKLKSDNTKNNLKKGQYLPSKSLQDHSLNKVSAMYILVFSDGILLSYKKKWNNAICSNMDISRDYYIKSEKDKYIRQILYFLSHQGSPSLTCGI